jgi:hypothetical protein
MRRARLTVLLLPLAAFAADEIPDLSRVREVDLEYCIDNASGLMQVHSIAPGTYFVYDYSGNQQYHGRIEPHRDPCRRIASS